MNYSVLSYVLKIRGISQTDLAKKLDNMNRANITYWNKAMRPIPQKHLDAIISILNIPSEILVDDKNMVYVSENIDILEPVKNYLREEESSRIISDLISANELKQQYYEELNDCSYVIEKTQKSCVRLIKKITHKDNSSDATSVEDALGYFEKQRDYIFNIERLLVALDKGRISGAELEIFMKVVDAVNSKNGEIVEMEESTKQLYDAFLNVRQSLMPNIVDYNLIKDLFDMEE